MGGREGVREESRGRERREGWRRVGGREGGEVRGGKEGGMV